nr:retrograde Golgi transport protein RGP1 [Hymenolepis microstoma]
MSDLSIAAQIHEPQIFLCGEMFRCEVTATSSNSKSPWAIRNIEGVLVGQYRLNLPSISDVYASGLDPQSHVSWIRLLKSKTHFPLQLRVEERSVRIILKTRLPQNLPPSYRGHIIRFAYKVLIKVDVDDKPIQILRLPFRVLPAVASYYPFDSSSALSASDLTSVTYSESQSVCGRINDPFHVDFNNQTAYGNDPFENGTIQKTTMHPAVYEKLNRLYTDDKVSSITNPSKKSKKNKSRRARTASLSQSPSAMFAEIVSSSSLASFMLSAPSGHICRIGIFKTVTRLGDSFRGYLDFRTASLPSFECIIRGETYEFFDPFPQTDIYPDKDLSFFTVPIDVPSVSKSKALKVPENAMITTWFETKLECANTKFLPFSIPIPLNAPAEFMLASRYWSGICRVHWCIRFDFAVAKVKTHKKSLSTPDSGLYNLFLRDTPISKNPECTPSIDCDAQTFRWELPVCVIPNGPIAFLLPSHSMSTFNFAES